MRKHLVWFLAAILAISVAGYAWARADTSTSTATMKVTPKKLSKTKFKKARIDVETSTVYNNGGGTGTAPTKQPAVVDKVTLGFDNDFKFTTKGLATCKQTDIAGTTTAAAKAKCGKAQVGQGHAVACFSGSGLGSNCAAVFNQSQNVVTAFNGQPQGGKPTLLLHVRTDAGAIHQTNIIPGVLSKVKAGDIGWKLVFTVPALPATALTDFTTSVTKSFTSKGKKYNYIAARCKDGNKKLNMTYDFHYSTAGESEDKGSTFSKCST
jgi:hypothetical protein